MCDMLALTLQLDDVHCLCGGLQPAPKRAQIDADILATIDYVTELVRLDLIDHYVTHKQPGLCFDCTAGSNLFAEELRSFPV